MNDFLNNKLSKLERALELLNADVKEMTKEVMDNGKRRTDYDRVVRHLESIIGFRYIARDIAKIARDSKTPNMDMREYLDGISGQISHLEKIDIEQCQEFVKWIFLDE